VPTLVPTVVLVTHVDPPIHGQAVMAAALAGEARSWTGARLVVVNTVYAAERESLARFSFRKVVRTLRYVISATVTARRTHAAVAVVTPSFYSGPFLKDALMVIALRTLARARIVAWVNMDPARLELERKPAWYRAVARQAFAAVDTWVACAPKLLEQWPSFVPRERRSVIAYGIVGAPTHAPDLGDDNAALRVCFLSSFDEAKGWADLLKAADEVCAVDSSVEFHFYGDVGVGSTKEQIADRFTSCGHPDRILWHGAVRGDAKWECLASADLFCLPSHTEQLPIVVLEAMSVGLPVVATRVGALEDAVVDGEGGWLVPPKRPAALADVLLDALSDRDRLKLFGRFNAARQRSEFSIERFGVQWEELLVRRVRGS
jgi:glycosyltransferase involved in cell wall biosynthesis